MNHELSSFIVTATAAVGLCACAPDEPEDRDSQAALQALLADGPLTQVPPGATGAGPGGARSNVVLDTAGPVGLWNFEDCRPNRTSLFDASLNDNTAFRSIGVACTQGIQGSAAVAIAMPEDIVYVPDEPSFTFERGVTVAGWFLPTAIGGTRTLFRKRDKDTSSFALLLHGGKFEFVVSLGEGRAISVTAPSKARVGVFQHVAASYDGSTARLYVDGFEVNRFAVSGTIPLGPGPLLMGNDGSERRFAGTLDGMLFATHALTAIEVQALICFPVTPTMSTGPSVRTTMPGVPVAIDIELVNHNPAACPAIRFRLVSQGASPDLVVDPPSGDSVESDPVPSGGSTHMTMTATPSASLDEEASLFAVFFVVEPITSFFGSANINIVVPESPACHVRTARELMIKSTSVVDDPVRTAFDPASGDPRNGVWTFKHLMENIAATPADAPAMVEAMLNSFTAPQTINGFVVAARPVIQGLVINPWPRTSDGALDLARAPLQLQAIVNRFDLRDLARGNAGEGHFVFAFQSASAAGGPLQATLIFEYKLPATTEQDVLDWAEAFHALGALPFGEDYNAALQAITERFVDRGVFPGHPNGSAISSVRTNELAFANGAHIGWGLRQFELSAASGRLEPAPLALTPDRTFNNTSALASYLNANQAAILAGTHSVPDVFDGAPFRAGGFVNMFGTWFAEGVDPEVRHQFALNTCNGCHGSETGAMPLQIVPRTGTAEASLSTFLTGMTIPDPFTRQLRTFHDLLRRNTDLKAVVCADPLAAAGADARSARLRKGIQRVH